jgi:hypothetical protein
LQATKKPPQGRPVLVYDDEFLSKKKPPESLLTAYREGFTARRPVSIRVIVRFCSASGHPEDHETPQIIDEIENCDSADHNRDVNDGFHKVSQLK